MKPRIYVPAVSGAGENLWAHYVDAGIAMGHAMQVLIFGDSAVERGRFGHGWSECELALSWQLTPGEARRISLRPESKHTFSVSN